ncbi:MAG: PDK repeat-containing protein [Bacteroidetes bacterium]|nr:MAG: PDK repeat-containing protein [Bacteroidota bacterium]
MARLLLYCFILCLCPLGVSATHIVGGEIYYDCLGGNNYMVTLKVYRDCINGQAPYDNPATVGVFDINGNLLQQLSLPFPGSSLVPPTINSPCYSPPGGVCVEEAIYTGTVNLPPIPGGYLLTYQRCCRNNTILNLINPGNVGSTYSIQVPDASLANCNNSARYNNFPPIYICAGAPLVFDHSATDPDGDSLAYELCDPFDGASAANPMPVPPAGPPYSFVPFAPPYSGAYPMSSNPAMAIDPVTGLLTGTPNMVGQWVVGVCVKEYRNGQLLCVNKRDFQFNVLNCPLLTVSSIPAQQIFCFGYTVQFQNNSFNATTYHWDFGDPTTNSDTSNLFAPTYTYADSGVYNVMLICNPGTACADTGYTTFYIYPLLQPTFTAPAGQCFNGNSFNFSAAGAFSGNGTFSWSFGANANPPGSSLQNPTNIVYDTTGAFLVSLTVTENGCTSSYIDTVFVYPMPTADFSAGPFVGCVPYTVQFSDSSIAGTPLIYLWSFGDGGTSTQANPVYTYNQVGVYDVTLIIATSNGCVSIDTFSVPGMVTVNPTPTAGFTVDSMSVSIFDPFITFYDQSVNGISCFYDFGDGTTTADCSELTHTFPAYGHYTVTQYVVNEYGCPDTAQLIVEVRPEFLFWIANAFTPNGDGLNDIFMPSIMGVENYKFLIFDRWGELIFESSNINKGWDGRYKGEKCQEDVYVWKLEFDDLPTGKQHRHIGHVTLIR